MTEQEAQKLQVGDIVVFAGLGVNATVNPFLTIGSVYRVGGSFHGSISGRGSYVVGIEMDDQGQDSWCYPDEVDALPSCKTHRDPDDGLDYSLCDDGCDSEEFCKKLLGTDDSVEPPCRCASPSNHDKDCAWKKWKDKQ